MKTRTAGCIVAPSGKVVAMCSTIEDELIVHGCNMDLGRNCKCDIFNFAYHRRLGHHGLIVERTGAEAPTESRTASSPR
ncbi:MAG: hypothetical protein GDA49_02920 [Rhodospirillales bacterium]|nr:hypothetical protein [Rhodospirillales bacterium]